MVGATIGAALPPRARLRRGEYVVKSALGLLLLRFSVTPPHADQRSYDPLITCPKVRCRPAACLSGALQATRLTQVLTPPWGSWASVTLADPGCPVGDDDAARNGEDARGYGGP
jgi:hypothetical protein